MALMNEPGTVNSRRFFKTKHRWLDWGSRNKALIARPQTLNPPLADILSCAKLVLGREQISCSQTFSQARRTAWKEAGRSWKPR